MTTIVEIVKYKLREGISIKEFQQIDELMQTFLRTQQGMLNRVLSFDETEKEYTDMVCWQDIVAARNAQDAYFESKVSEALGEIIQKQTVFMSHNQLLSTL